jgi:TPR repeat protein
MKAILRGGLLALAIMAMALPANAGPFEDGMAATLRGDHAAALKFWRPLAEKGDARAQFYLGVMYDAGEGLPQDRVESVKWTRLAAEQENVDAQYFLGIGYHFGKGAPQDYSLAHM